MTIKVYKKTTSLLFLYLLLTNLVTGQVILPNNQDIRYMGRIDTIVPNQAFLYWSGTSININFEGTSIKAIFKDEKGDNYYNIIIDGKLSQVLKTKIDSTEYLLTSNLQQGKHNLEIFKRTEWDRGKTIFYGFITGENTQLLPANQNKTKKIEFYGNSITAGYGVEDYSEKDRSDSIFTNNYLSYATLTAKHFDAQFHCICKSGIGIMVSWFPIIMPEIYNRTNPIDPNSKWDFKKFTPDVVIINLLQNDSWLVKMPKNDEFKRVFKTTPPDENFIINAYKNFVLSVRNKYPDCEIVCMLGNMDITRKGSPWPGYVEKAVIQLNDKKVSTLIVPYKNTPGHPKVAEQKQMADLLISFLEKKMDW